VVDSLRRAVRCRVSSDAGVRFCSPLSPIRTHSPSLPDERTGKKHEFLFRKLTVLLRRLWVTGEVYRPFYATNAE
jgi:hypothetical protein